MNVIDTKFVVGKYYKPVRLEISLERIFFHFAYCKQLIEEVKAMEGARYHGFDESNPRKIWSVKNSARNLFQIEHLKGNNPYARYDLPLAEYTSQRPLYYHQCNMVAHVLARRHCILAAEMGTGKTLVYIEVMEQSKEKDWWVVAPKSALKSVYLDLKKWNCSVSPKLMTYDGLKRVVENWSGAPAPYGVIFDEGSRLKNEKAKRSIAALHVADSIRKERGTDSFIVIGSGSPAPKSPVDWWHICEVACPGFLKEGNSLKFQKRLGLIVEKESITGGIYPHLVTWRDDPRKCDKCGEYADAPIHDLVEPGFHDYVPSTDEVSKLYTRMSGLVVVVFKKDCLDLPEMQYRTIQCTPSKSTLRFAEVLAESARSTITALTQLRELSDGFQYYDEIVGKDECPLCHGRKVYTINEREESCPSCGGTGEVIRYERAIRSIACPKEEVLRDLLDEHEEIGRIVIYAGFTGSIDKCVEVCKSEGWVTLRVDGRGWDASGHETDDLLKAMDNAYKGKYDHIPKLAFIGQAGSGGMGLTLTASPTIVFYSNDFNAESRIQAEARIHRIGMDVNRGATIIDLVHLPTDQYVLDNLKKKKDLQSKTLGELKSAISESINKISMDDTTPAATDREGSEDMLQESKEDN